MIEFRPIDWDKVQTLVTLLAILATAAATVVLAVLNWKHFKTSRELVEAAKLQAQAATDQARAAQDMISESREQWLSLRREKMNPVMVAVSDTIASLIHLMQEIKRNPGRTGYSIESHGRKLEAVGDIIKQNEPGMRHVVDLIQEELRESSRANHLALDNFDRGEAPQHYATTAEHIVRAIKLLVKLHDRFEDFADKIGAKVNADYAESLLEDIKRST